MVVHALDVAVMLVAIHQLLRNRDWLAGAGWSGSRKLCAAALALAAFTLITSLPTDHRMFLTAHHLDPLGGRRSGT
jgi:hypothetical protein